MEAKKNEISWLVLLGDSSNDPRIKSALEGALDHHNDEPLAALQSDAASRSYDLVFVAAVGAAAYEWFDNDDERWEFP